MAFSTVFLLSMSTVYHLLGQGTGRDVMRQLDIAGVFALIAGTMTPDSRDPRQRFQTLGIATPGLVSRRNRYYAEDGFLGKPSIWSWYRHIPAVRLVWTDHMHSALEAIQLLLRQTVVLGRRRLLTGGFRSGTGFGDPDSWGRRCS
jgi:hypothetical protein